MSLISCLMYMHIFNILFSIPFFLMFWKGPTETDIKLYVNYTEKRN